jgi:ABC-type multidrug transport system ATPase subunit
MAAHDRTVFVARNLRRSYDGRVVVDDFTASIDAGEIVVLVGPNGSGKTTSVEMSLGLRRTEAGSSEICGFDVRRDRHKVAPLLGVALQGASLNNRVRVREHLQFFGAIYRTAAQAFEVAQLLGLDEEVMKKPYGRLSGGLQRRVLVAAALAGLPSFTMLDEPTSGVDVESRIALWSALRNVQDRIGTGFLITTHDLAEAEQYADRVIVMRAGRVIGQGRPREFIQQTGLSRVISVRGNAGLDVDDLAMAGAHVLYRGHRELRLGFRTPEAAEPLRQWIAAHRDEVVADERPASFEDAYLSTAAQEPVPAVNEDRA